MRSYGAACAYCKRRRQKCVWPSDAATACEACVTRKQSDDCIPPPDQTNKRRARDRNRPYSTSSSPSPSPPPSSYAGRVALNPTHRRLAETSLADLLADELMAIFKTHWAMNPPGLEVDHVVGLGSRARGQIERLPQGSNDKAIYLLALALSARSSANPAISGPSAPPLAFVESRDSDAVDLSPFGKNRAGPCESLIRQAMDACDLVVPSSTHGVQILLMRAYLNSTVGGDDNRLGSAIGTFRDMTPGHTWQKGPADTTHLGQLLILQDAMEAFTRLLDPHFSDADVDRFFPPTSLFEPVTFDCLAFLADRDGIWPDDGYFEPGFQHNFGSRVRMVREAISILKVPPRDVDEVVPRLRALWAEMDRAWATSRATLQFSLMLREEVCNAPMDAKAISRVLTLVAFYSSTEGRAQLIQFLIHSVVRSWWAEKSLKDPAVFEESLRITRRCIKVVASQIQHYLPLPEIRSVPVSTTLRRMESGCPDWVDIALERLEEGERHLEVTLEELEYLSVGLRLMGWSFGRAAIRVQELDQGIVALRQAEFQTMQEDGVFDLSQYLDLSAL